MFVSVERGHRLASYEPERVLASTILTRLIVIGWFVLRLE